jgi:hypothetical protein
MDDTKANNYRDICWQMMRNHLPDTANVWGTLNIVSLTRRTGRLRYVMFPAAWERVHNIYSTGVLKYRHTIGSYCTGRIYPAVMAI